MSLDLKGKSVIIKPRGDLAFSSSRSLGGMIHSQKEKTMKKL